LLSLLNSTKLFRHSLILAIASTIKLNWQKLIKNTSEISPLVE